VSLPGPDDNTMGYVSCCCLFSSFLFSFSSSLAGWGCGVITAYRRRMGAHRWLLYVVMGHVAMVVLSSLVVLRHWMPIWSRTVPLTIISFIVATGRSMDSRVQVIVLPQTACGLIRTYLFLLLLLAIHIAGQGRLRLFNPICRGRNIIMS
jgi:hypothetical protein